MRLIIELNTRLTGTSGWSVKVSSVCGNSAPPEGPASGRYGRTEGGAGETCARRPAGSLPNRTRCYRCTRAHFEIPNPCDPHRMPAVSMRARSASASAWTSQRKDMLRMSVKLAAAHRLAPHASRGGDDAEDTPARTAPGPARVTARPSGNKLVRMRRITSSDASRTRWLGFSRAA
jgi:hypothetical protein